MVVDYEDLKDSSGLEKLQTYAKSLPYSIEPNSKMQSLLDFYLMRFVQVSILLK
jgi:proteasome activator subunit 4